MRRISGGMVGNSNYIGTSLNGLIQEVKLKEKKPIQFPNFFSLNQVDRTSHWVVHSALKELYINDPFEIKHMIEDMEAKLTEASKN